MFNGISQVGQVPIDDGCDHQGEARCTELLSVLSQVRDAALLEGADHLSQRMGLRWDGRLICGRGGGREANLKAAVENMVEGIVMIGADGKVALHNPP